MTKKTNAQLMEQAAIALEKQAAELKKLRPLSRAERLRQAESSLKPKTRSGRLIEAEHQVEASEPRDSRAIYSEMRPAKQREPTKKPEPVAALARAVRAKRDPSRR